MDALLHERSRGGGELGFHAGTPRLALLPFSVRKFYGCELLESTEKYNIEYLH